jgi:hypothetical protein
MVIVIVILFYKMVGIYYLVEGRWVELRLPRYRRDVPPFRGIG